MTCIIDLSEFREFEMGQTGADRPCLTKFFNHNVNEANEVAKAQMQNALKIADGTTVGPHGTAVGSGAPRFGVSLLILTFEAYVSSLSFWMFTTNPHVP